MRALMAPRGEQTACWRLHQCGADPLLVQYSSAPSGRRPRFRSRSTSSFGGVTALAPAAPNSHTREVPKNHTQGSHPMFTEAAPILEVAPIFAGAQAFFPVADGFHHCSRARLPEEEPRSRSQSSYSLISAANFSSGDLRGSVHRDPAALLDRRCAHMLVPCPARPLSAHASTHPLSPRPSASQDRQPRGQWSASGHAP
jgi:hypothetical protein